MQLLIYWCSPVQCQYIVWSQIAAPILNVLGRSLTHVQELTPSQTDHHITLFTIWQAFFLIWAISAVCFSITDMVVEDTLYIVLAWFRAQRTLDGGQWANRDSRHRGFTGFFFFIPVFLLVLWCRIQKTSQYYNSSMRCVHVVTSCKSAALKSLPPTTVGLVRAI